MAVLQNQIAFSAEKQNAQPHVPESWWEGLCRWLTTNLKGMEMTLQRRENGGDWTTECLPHPLESVSTREAANGVQIIAINADINGKSRVFEIAGPDSITLYKDPAGLPVRVEISNQGAQLFLCFSGPMRPQRRNSSNAWGE